jgi:hypothetical protein
MHPRRNRLDDLPPFERVGLRQRSAGELNNRAVIKLPRCGALSRHVVRLGFQYSNRINTARCLAAA